MAHPWIRWVRRARYHMHCSSYCCSNILQDYIGLYYIHTIHMLCVNVYKRLLSLALSVHQLGIQSGVANTCKSEHT